MTANILLINVHSSRNAGDAALVDVTLAQLRQNFPSCQINLCMDDPTSHQGAEPTVGSIAAWVHQAVPGGTSRWNLARLAWLLPAALLPAWSRRLLGRPFYALTPASLRSTLQAYLAADLVISAPGGFLYSSGSGLVLALMVFSLALALLAGKPVYLFPQSVGPLHRPWEGRMLRWVLERLRMVMLREPLSLRLVQEIGVRNPRCRLVPDLAFVLPAAGREAGTDWLCSQGLDPQDGRPRLGMTMVNWGAQNPRFARQEAYERACAAAARWFVQQCGGQVIFFPQVWGPLASQDDRIPARRAAAQLADLGDAICVVQDPLPQELLKSVYGWMDLFIGTRMHSNIFALSQGVPVIAIGYLHKTQGIAEMAGLGQWAVEIGQADETILVERLAALWSEREAWRAHIAHVIPPMVQQAAGVGRMVAQDYAALRWESQK